MSAASTSNVREFKPRLSEHQWANRLWCVLTALGLGWVLQQTSIPRLEIVTALVLVYWVFVHRGRRMNTYFVRSHWLHALIGFGLLALLDGGISAFLRLMTAAIALTGPHAWVFSPMFEFLRVYPVAVGWIMLAFGVYLAALAALGKYPKLPLISENVRVWA